MVRDTNPLCYSQKTTTKLCVQYDPYHQNKRDEIREIVCHTRKHMNDANRTPPSSNGIRIKILLCSV